MTLSKARMRLLQRLQRRKQREREECFVVEGVRSSRAALTAAIPVRFAVLSPRLAELDDGRLAELLRRARFDVVTVDNDLLEELAGTVTPQGILLVCEAPRAGFGTLKAGADGVLIADAVQDPGNLGSMVRTAAAFGMSGVIALDGTVDPWNPKVVRAGAGGCFQVPIVRASCDETLGWVRATGVQLLAADPEGDDVANAENTPPWALAVGNEGSGVRPSVRSAAAKIIGVPVDARSDSLNAGVAAAILCYELNRRKAR